jgi:hypothetical protein
MNQALILNPLKIQTSTCNPLLKVFFAIEELLDSYETFLMLQLFLRKLDG